jgi:hypothetical protein
MSHSLIAAAFIATVAFAPTSLHAQHVDGSRALLARVDTPVPVAAFQHIETIDGERALLGRSVTHSRATDNRLVAIAPAKLERFSGAYALLARR